MSGRALLFVMLSLASAGCGGERRDSVSDQAKEQKMGSSRNPADDPGAIVYYPSVDPMMRYDREENIVVDERSGDHMAYQVSDMRELTFIFRIRDVVTGTYTYFPGRAFAYDKPGYGQTTAFEIFGARPPDYPKSPPLYTDQLSLERLSRFINANGNVTSHAGDVVLIDNREKYRRPK